MRSLGFVLLSPRERPMPSTRIATLNLFPMLRARGYEPAVLWEPPLPAEVPERLGIDALLQHGRPDIVAFQKVHGPAVLAAVRRLRGLGIRTLWIVCDLVDNAMAHETDATVASTPFLRSLFDPRLQHKIAVVHDGIEDDRLVAASAGADVRRPTALMVSSQDLTIVPVVGGGVRRWRIRILGPYSPDPRQRLKASLRAAVDAARWSERYRVLKAACDRRISFLPWSLPAVASEVAHAQIGIIPIETNAGSMAEGTREPTWRVKSENRLTLLMGAALPVIATPIPSYEAVLRHGENGFFARTVSDWRLRFAQLRDPGLRREMGARARHSVLPAYSKERQADRLVAVLDTLIGLPDRTISRDTR
jgi:glycosyltransferase involved in cell wall biosynthesis